MNTRPFTNKTIIELQFNLSIRIAVGPDENSDCVCVCVCIGVLRHMQQYFSYICDGTDVQADWRRSCTYGRAPKKFGLDRVQITESFMFRIRD